MILKFFKEFTNLGLTFCLYFYDESQCFQFSIVNKKYVRKRFQTYTILEGWTQWGKWRSFMKQDNNFKIQICQIASYASGKPYIPLAITETASKSFEILHIVVFRYAKKEYLTVHQFSELGQTVYTITKSAIEVCNLSIKYFSF